MTSSEKLYQTIKDFPESIITEVLDFAEFLQNKKKPLQVEHSGDEFLVELKGGLENSTVFVGNPVKIQEQLRNDWD